MITLEKNFVAVDETEWVSWYPLSNRVLVRFGNGPEVVFSADLIRRLAKALEFAEGHHKDLFDVPAEPNPAP